MKVLKLVILIEVQSGKADEQIALYKKIRPLVLNEEGCISYEMSRVSGSDVKFVLTESWKSKESLEVHDAMPYMIEADSISPTFRAGPAIVLELTEL